jgi:hypothetical protein
VGAKREAGVSPAQSRCCKLKRVETHKVKSLCDAIAAWEDGVETSKPEDLPNRIFIGKAFEERRSDHRILHGAFVVCAAFLCVSWCFPPCLPIRYWKLKILIYQQLKVSNYGKKVIDFILGADVSL